MTDLPIEIVVEVTHHLEDLKVEFMMVGSVASSLLGTARSTIDADLVADLSVQHLEPLRRKLEEGFYVSPEAMAEALRRRSMFNVIHFSSGFKIDIYLLGNRPFDQEEFRRRRLFQHRGQKLWVATAEDLILSKLDWYRLGEEVSERQWRDLVGLLQVHQKTLDYEYLQRWAQELKLKALWQRALAAVGLSGHRDTSEEAPGP